MKERVGLLWGGKLPHVTGHLRGVLLPNTTLPVPYTAVFYTCATITTTP